MATALSARAPRALLLDHLPASPVASAPPTRRLQRPPEVTTMPATAAPSNPPTKPARIERTPKDAVLAGQDAFEALVTQFERPLLGYLTRMTGDEQTARDLSQETLLRAWQHFALLSTYDSPAAWLFRVASNLAISHLRRRATLVGSAQLLGDDDGPARGDPTLRLIEYDLIQRTLGTLPPKQRATLVLREVYGLTCDEIAHQLGTSRDAVKMTLWRGRQRFRARYTRENAHR